MKLRFPRTVIDAGRNVEKCFFVRLPATEAFDLASWEVKQNGFSGTGVAITHFLVYALHRQRAGEFPQAQREAVDSRGCLDLGPADRDARQLIATANTANTRGVMPAGLSLPLAPTPAAPGGAADGIGILLDANWVNSGTKPRAVSARLVLTAAQPGTVRRRLQPILARDAEAGIAVPPFGLAPTDALIDARWRPPGDACLLDITGKMHRRGRFFAVEARDSADRPREPLDGLRHLLTGAPTLFGSPDYTDPGTRRFTPRALPGRRRVAPLRLLARERRPAAAPARLCSQRRGRRPERAGAPAAECTPGCACVPANLVAGPDAR